VDEVRIDGVNVDEGKEDNGRVDEWRKNGWRKGRCRKGEWCDCFVHSKKLYTGTGTKHIIECALLGSVYVKML
jgi:hypothetical protein